MKKKTTSEDSSPKGSGAMEGAAAVCDGGPTREGVERWETGRGDGSGIYLAGDPATRVKIGDFGEGGEAPGGSAAAAKRAQLASAAPDLLRELRHLVRLMEAKGEHALGVPGLATLNGARAAIAKAEGRTT